MGEAKIFRFHCETNILHSESALGSRIQVLDSQLDRPAVVGENKYFVTTSKGMQYMNPAMISLKKTIIFVVLAFLFLPGISMAEQKINRYQPGNINHIVVVWFKEGIDTKTKKGFIEASKSLSNLPGVVGHSVGQMLPADREIVDSTFDVAVVVTVENKAALKVYLDHPTHKEIVKTVFRPVVDKVLIYDALVH